jgi:hypothetical protein
MNNIYNSNKNSLLKIKLLENEYSIILNQYEETYKNYLSSLSKKDEFITIKGKTWWGKNPLKQNKVNSKDDCITMCANDDKCSGATYNDKKKYCWTRMGDDNLKKGKKKEYAIISNIKLELLTLNLLNKKLIDINKAIVKELNNVDIEIININKLEKQEELTNNYIKLIKERENVNIILEKYKDIESSLNNQELYVNQENAKYKLWVLIASIILLITLNQLFIGKKIPNGILFRILLIIVLLIMSFSLNTRHGFLIVIIVLLVILLMSIGIIPLPFEN